MNYRNFLALLLLLTTGLFIISCQKEEPLKPNNLATGPTPLLDYNPDSTNNGGNGGGGGEPGFDQYFTAEVDGTLKVFPSYNYVTGMTGTTFSGSNTTTNSTISISSGDSLKTGTSIEFDGFSTSASYIENFTSVYTSRSGTLTIDSLTSEFIMGEFDFVGENSSNPDDTVVVENGVFKIAI